MDKESHVLSLFKDNETLQTMEYSRKERIAARRQRVEQKKNEKISLNMNEEQAKNDNKDLKDGDNLGADLELKLDEAFSNQLQITNAKLDQITNKTKRLITDKIVQSTRKEVVRRQREEESKYVDLVSGTVDYVVDETKSYNEIKNPYELYDILLKHEQQFNEIMIRKSERINILRERLKAKDKEYTEEMKAEAAEIYLLFIDMNQHYQEYRQLIKHELDDLEIAMMKDRKALIQKTFGNLMKMMEQLKAKEREYYETHGKRAENYLENYLDAMNVESENDRKTKEKLESDIHILKIKLQEMKAVFQLNSEKLEYNYQVLKKREEENTMIVSLQKRKINRLNDHISNIKLKLIKQKDSFDKEMRVLQDDYDRISAQWKDFTSKSRKFEQNEARKYQELIDMHKDEINDGMRQIIKVDKIISEEILGTEWQCPEEWKQYLSDEESETSELEMSKEEWKTVYGDEDNRNLLESIRIYAGNLILDSSSTTIMNKNKTFIYRQILQVLGVKTIEDFDRLKQRVLEKEEGELLDVLADWITNKGATQQKPSLSNSVVLDSEYIKQALDALSSNRLSKWADTNDVMREYQKELTQSMKSMKEMELLERENDELKRVLRDFLPLK